MSKYFQPNPAGRPKSSAWVKHLAAKYTEEALTTLADIMRDADEDGRTRAMAAQALLDRAHGRPAQEINGNVNVTSSPDELYEQIAAAVAEFGVQDDAGSTGEPH